MSFSSIPLVFSYGIPPALNTLSCRRNYISKIRSCTVQKQRENGSLYNQGITLGSAIQIRHDISSLVFKNVNANDEGCYKCVTNDGTEVCSGCIFIAGK